MVRILRTAAVFTLGYLMGAGGCDLLMKDDYSPLEKKTLTYERKVTPSEYQTKEPHTAYRIDH